MYGLDRKMTVRANVYLIHTIFSIQQKNRKNQ